MAWVVQQRAIPADDVMPDSMAEEEHAAVRILNLLGGISAANMPGPQQVEMTGLEDVLKRVTYHCLQWLRQVRTKANGTQHSLKIQAKMQAWRIVPQHI